MTESVETPTIEAPIETPGIGQIQEEPAIVEKDIAIAPPEVKEEIKDMASETTQELADSIPRADEIAEVKDAIGEVAAETPLPLSKMKVARIGRLLRMIEAFNKAQIRHCTLDRKNRQKIAKIIEDIRSGQCKNQLHCLTIILHHMERIERRDKRMEMMEDKWIQRLRDALNI